MSVYAITGASRGIGFELTRQLLELPSSQIGKIFALSRTVTDGLKDLISRNPDRLFHAKISVDSTESVQQAAKDVKAKLDGQGLDVLINNAGVAEYTTGLAADVKPESFTYILDINVVGPQRVTTAFLPLLEQGKGKKVIQMCAIFPCWNRGAC